LRELLLAAALMATCGMALAVQYPTDWSPLYAGNPDSEVFVDPGTWVQMWQNCDPGYAGEYIMEQMSGYRYVSLVDFGPGGHSPWIDYSFDYHSEGWFFQQDITTGRAYIDGAIGEWCILEFGGGTWYDTTTSQYFDPTPEQIKFTVVPEPAVVSSLAGFALALGGIFGFRRR
jgi:hypothetical protein